MYTQCPDCSTAFRVTAEVLKQAAGTVRCGGCGNAFNALEYLSEDMPGQPAVQDHDEPLAQLTPEPLQTDEGVPTSISAEQGAALLKTLDELAGSDIRIEDTGVEWRVLDDDEASEAAADDDAADISNIGDSAVDALLEESPMPVEELRFDDNTPLPDDFNLDDISSYEPESPDSDLSETNAEAESGFDHEPVDITLSEPDEWADILDEVDETSRADGASFGPELVALVDSAEEDAEEPAVESGNDLDGAEELLDVDTQFALQAEAMGIDLSGMHQTSEDESEQAIHEAPDEEPDENAEPELELEARAEAEDLAEDEAEDEDETEDEDLAEAEDEDLAEAEDTRNHHIDVEEDVEEEEEQEQAPLLFGSIDTAIEELEQQSDVFDKSFFEAEDAVDPESHEDVPDPATSEENEHIVPPQTEEEQTLNLMIDQDLLSFAVEDEDGFASTIVIQQKDAEEKAIAEDRNWPTEEDGSVGFESIIMEGEFVRSALDDEKREADMAEAAELAEQARAARDAKSEVSTEGRRHGMTAAVVALVVLLLVQVMHQSREGLATIPAFNNLIGPVYRAIGKPLSPAWDITGWRFEATKDISDENDAQLTFYSRIGNTSNKPLPYPLISISLTDRFEETIGSRMLNPAEYLTNNLDPGKLVQPGNTFNAVISVRAPTRDAMGYKLKACYRLSEGQLRCKMPDFR
ncbi:MAG: DUF3426 domain-containing protein [Gammaproteobacteria bacterium]|nr:DUF3426 domain-containing protein [Gammaproteobacteria bacterium]